MPRPLKMRSVQRPPLHGGFKPTGVKARFLKDITLTLDEFEAIRLADYEGQDQIEAAAAMGISRSTFSPVRTPRAASIDGWSWLRSVNDCGAFSCAQ